MKWNLRFEYRTANGIGSKDFNVEVEAPIRVRAETIGRAQIPPYYRPHAVLAEAIPCHDTEH